MAASPPDPIPEEGRLDSWKQIAGYLDKSERTVRRWSQTEGLPVHKHQHQQRGSVWAYQKELDEWLAVRRISPEPLVEVTESDSEPEPAPAPTPRRTPWLYLAISAAAISITTFAWFFLNRPPEPLEEPVPFTSLPGTEASPSFSPDGRKVVFNHRDRIVIKDMESEVVTTLVEPGSFAYDPAWSPDGKTIAFLRRNEERETWLHLIPATGGPEQKLALLTSITGLYANLKHISWSPDGQSILAPMRAGRARETTISRILLNGQTRPLTDPKDSANLYSSQIAPDGRAFVYLRRNGPSTSAIFETEVLIQRLSRDGSPQGTPQTIFKADLSPNGIAWAPDGKSLIFCTATASQLEPRLFRLAAEEGAKLIQLGPNECSTVGVSRPNSSGRAMLLYGSSENAKSGLFQRTSEPPGSPAPFAPSSRSERFPSYSPNGQAVAFLSTRGGKRDIWIAKSDGTEPRRLTDTGNIYSKPEWSPDGNLLVYTASTSSLGLSLTVTPATGGSPKTISTGSRDVHDPVWSRDGKSIYYAREYDIWRCGADGSGHVKVFSNGHAPLGESADGRFLYLLRASKRFFLLLRIPKAGGAEEVLDEGLMKNRVTVAPTAVYYVLLRDGTVRRLPFQGGGPSTLAAFFSEEESKARVISGISVSPDEKTIIWTEGGNQERDLELIRNFR